MADTLLELRGLCKTFPVGRHDRLQAVRGVDLSLARGESLGHGTSGAEKRQRGLRGDGIIGTYDLPFLSSESHGPAYRLFGSHGQQLRNRKLSFLQNLEHSGAYQSGGTDKGYFHLKISLSTLEAASLAPSPGPCMSRG